VSGLIANKKLEKCPEIDSKPTCESDALARAYRTPRTISTIGFWTGAVLVVGGVSALIVGLQPSEQRPQHVRWDVGPTGVAVHGEF
jgi:hypothetical protein